jgi:hypothetical protein
VAFYCTGSGSLIAAGTTISTNVTTNRWVGRAWEPPRRCLEHGLQGTVFGSPASRSRSWAPTGRRSALRLDPPSVLVVQPGAHPRGRRGNLPDRVHERSARRLPHVGDHGGPSQWPAPVNCPGGTCWPRSSASVGGNTRTMSRHPRSSARVQHPAQHRQRAQHPDAERPAAAPASTTSVRWASTTASNGSAAR